MGYFVYKADVVNKKGKQSIRWLAVWHGIGTRENITAESREELLKKINLADNKYKSRPRKPRNINLHKPRSLRKRKGK